MSGGSPVGNDDLETIKQRYAVVTTAPSINGWNVEVVGERLEGYEGEPVKPDLEHAYVYFMESRKIGRGL
jgi:ABC-2 type transport system ATP-binding protein